MTSFFIIKGAHFSRKRQDRFAPTLFQGLEENTCSLQPALKSNALGL